MSNLKDTDFDDLFRRASEKYPLRTDSSDWDKMAAALEKDPTPSPDDSNGSGDSRKRRVFWLFLLLPLAGIGYITWHAAGRSDGHADKAAVVAKSPASADAATGAKAAAGDKAGADAASRGNAATGGSAATGTGATTATSSNPASDGTGAKPAAGAGERATGAAKSATGGAKSVTGGAKSATGAGAPATDAAIPATTTAGSATTPVTARLADGKASSEPTHNAPSGAMHNTPSGVTHNAPSGAKHNRTIGKAHNTVIDPANSSSIDAAHNGTTDGAQNSSIDPAKNPIAAGFTLRQSPVDVQRAHFADAYAVMVDVKAPEKQIEKRIEKQSDSSKPQASRKKKSSYLYAGVIVAPDLSTVKMQHVSGVGNSFGVLLGYAFNAHWAVETGAYVERKRYYTDGEYFSTKQVRLPASSTLLNVDGTCYMWEIPLNLRYNFNPGARTQWFATAGLSTYLMNREKYSYKYDYAGWGTSTTSNWNIKKNSQYPFSIIGLSAGFEQRLGKLGNLRVEPYVRIPLGGIGTGSLPIMSTGINIGFTRRLW